MPCLLKDSRRSCWRKNLLWYAGLCSSKIWILLSNQSFSCRRDWRLKGDVKTDCLIGSETKEVNQDGRDVQDKAHRGTGVEMQIISKLD